MGVEVELTWFDDYLASLTALSAGQLDGNRQTLNDTLVGVSAGDDQVVVLVNDNSAERVVVMSGRPGRVTEDVAVPYGRTRGPDIRRDQRFLALEDEIDDLLRQPAKA